MNRSIAFIFDMDGTIIDNMQFHTQAWLTFLSDMGIEMTPEELHSRNYGTIVEVIRRLCGDRLAALSDREARELGERKETLYREIYRPHLKLIAGFDRFLEKADRSEIAIAMGTSAGKANIDFVLQELEIASLFDVVVGGSDVQNGKPDPETFLIAAQRLNVSPEKCIVFEDNLSGIEAAQNAGMRAIAITTSFPASTFKNFSAILKIIDDYTEIEPDKLLKNM
ncbi:MAG: HAD family hydrolase, partial [Xenococcaceae cyanobacterium]